VYDAVVNRIIDGYAELAGRRLRPETGALIILLYRLMAAFDNEYERRARDGGALDFDGILNGAPVNEHLRRMSAFLAPHPERHALREFLERFAATNFERYRELTASRGVADQLALVELDSAGQLICTAYAIGIFNGHEPPASIVDEFAHVGIVGKLADDLIDVWTDHAEGSANLFATVVRDHPDEYQVFLANAATAPRPHHHLWRSHCPSAFAAYTRIVAEHRGKLTAPSLCIAADLMLLPAALGGPATR
jgi:hypothetical protein